VDLRQSYDELRKNLGRSQEELKKILRSFENRAPSLQAAHCFILWTTWVWKYELEKTSLVILIPRLLSGLCQVHSRPVYEDVGFSFKTCHQNLGLKTQVSRSWSWSRNLGFGLKIQVSRSRVLILKPVLGLQTQSWKYKDICIKVLVSRSISVKSVILTSRLVAKSRRAK